MDTQTVPNKKEPIRHDLRKNFLYIKGFKENEPYYQIKVSETSCEYDTKRTGGLYFAELIDHHKHSEGVNIIVKTNIRPLSKEIIENFHLIPIKAKGLSWLKKTINMFNREYEYMLSPYYQAEGRASDHPGKIDGRYEKYLALLKTREVEK